MTWMHTGFKKQEQRSTNSQIRTGWKSSVRFQFVFYTPIFLSIFYDSCFFITNWNTFFPGKRMARNLCSIALNSILKIWQNFLSIFSITKLSLSWLEVRKMENNSSANLWKNWPLRFWVFQKAFLSSNVRLFESNLMAFRPIWIMWRKKTLRKSLKLSKKSFKTIT